MQYDILTILGPTACGKTSFAAQLAARMGKAEILSADSRQLYRGMDIGTGKDLADYMVGDKKIPYHLIDIADAGEKLNLFQYQMAFQEAYTSIKERGNIPILCGGTGLYIESILKSYRMMPVPENPSLRKELSKMSLEELTQKLSSLKQLHNTTDVDTPKRAIRAIEIALYYQEHPVEGREFPQLESFTIGLSIDRETRRRKISERLHHRLEEEHMVDEVRGLLEKVSPDDLIYYGLEYKYLTLYCIGKLSYDEMVHELEIAIHQFAKRQMTWFRGMERRGTKIHWIDSSLSLDDKFEELRRMGLSTLF